MNIEQRHEYLRLKRIRKRAKTHKSSKSRERCETYQAAKLEKEAELKVEVEALLTVAETEALLERIERVQEFDESCEDADRDERND